MRPIFFMCSVFLLLNSKLLFSAAIEDPINSGMWDYFHQRILDGEKYIFDAKVKLNAPPFAEDARQVPLEIDAREIQGKVKKIVLWAELNPIPRILTVTPHSQDIESFIAVRIRVEQATPIRAAILLEDGVWHVGSTYIDAVGGGCTAPSLVRTEEGWEKNLGKIFGARFELGNSSRLKINISHPMDNGLDSSIPEFYLDTAQLRDRAGKILADLELFAALSENPIMTLSFKNNNKYQMWVKDNNGNEFLAPFL